MAISFAVMTGRKIKVAIIGVGYLGRHHVEQFLQIPEAEVVGIHDVRPEVMAEIERQHGVRTFQGLGEVFAGADAVSIVVPTQKHYEVALKALEAGCHVFIEKPISQTLTEADTLIQKAKDQGCMIQVGHIERLNPAARALEKYALDPRFIEGHRLASFSSRGTDVPVVLDLMIHDIDVVLHLIKSPVIEIRANGVNVITDSVDIATARLEFENGAVANLTASRISQKQMRKLRIFQSHFYIGVDFLQQLTEVYRLVRPDEADPDAELTMPFEFNGRRRLITYEKPPIHEDNALRLELSNFIRSVAGLEKPIVDGYAAREALEVAIRIQEAIAAGQTLPEQHKPGK